MHSVGQITASIGAQFMSQADSTTNTSRVSNWMDEILDPAPDLPWLLMFSLAMKVASRHESAQGRTRVPLPLPVNNSRVTSSSGKSRASHNSVPAYHTPLLADLWQPYKQPATIKYGKLVTAATDDRGDSAQLLATLSIVTAHADNVGGFQARKQAAAAAAASGSCTAGSSSSSSGRGGGQDSSSSSSSSSGSSLGCSIAPQPGFKSMVLLLPVLAELLVLLLEKPSMTADSNIVACCTFMHNLRNALKPLEQQQSPQGQAGTADNSGAAPSAAAAASSTSSASASAVGVAVQQDLDVLPVLMQLVFPALHYAASTAADREAAAIEGAQGGINPALLEQANIQPGSTVAAALQTAYKITLDNAREFVPKLLAESGAPKKLRCVYWGFVHFNAGKFKK